MLNLASTINDASFLTESEIPPSYFVVFYNGEEEQPEVQELKLSDAFEKPTDEPNLELKCKVYNINDGKNKAIMESCGWLNDYMTFVNKVREYHADGAFDDLALSLVLILVLSLVLILPR